MEIRRADLTSEKELDGVVVVIDVLRAATTACYAFSVGVRDIILASSVEHALALRDRFPGSLIAGEIDGYPVDGFDLGNSPSQLLQLDLRGRRLIQRTTAGTQGAFAAAKAKFLYLGCLCNLGATASRVLLHAHTPVTLLATGVAEGGWGDEDVACGDCLEALLTGRMPDIAGGIDRVRRSRSGGHYTEPNHHVFPASDLELATRVDSFQSALEVHKEGNLLIASPQIAQKPNVSLEPWTPAPHRTSSR